MTTDSADLRPTIAIYQDPSYVEGILQQANKGLLTDLAEASDLRRTDSTKSGEVRGGDFGTELKVPGIGGLKATAKFGADDGTTHEGAAGQQTTRNFKYTTSFYLHHVRQDLRSAGLLKVLSGSADVGNLTTGDFVEFRASFKPDELIALMDVLSPSLVGSIIRWIRKRALIAQIVAADPEDQQSLLLEYQTRPDADADFASAMAEAVRVDFRSVDTREYYGSIDGAPSVTAVVVCDTRSFLVADADRILDGHFTVLGKVSTPPETDVPILARNKVLDRIQPEAVDFVTSQLRGLAEQKVEGASSAMGEDETMDKYLDLNFPSRIDGISFKVIPVAIYI